MSIVINSPASSASVSGTVAVGFTVTNTYSATGGGSVTLSQSAALSVATGGLANGAQTLKVEGAGQSATLAVIVSNAAGASPDGSTLTPPTTGQLIDNLGAVWTLSAVSASQKVFKNGALAGFTDQVTLLLWYNGTIWQRNVGNLWWPWNNTSNSWTGSGVADPRPPAATLSIANPVAAFSATSPIAIAGLTNQSSVQVFEGASLLANITPSGGSFSTSLTLAVGAHTLVFSAGSATAITRSGNVLSQGALVVPAFDHIVVVVMENHSYNEIVGAAAAPYINNTLIAGGALMTNYKGVSHPSQPNYLAMYAGSTFGVADDNNVNLGSQPTWYTLLNAAGKTFRGFGEAGNIERKHSPWESFTEGTSVESAFSTFNGTNPAHTVSFISPAPLNNMHDGTIAQGDTWLSNNINAYAQWAKTHNSLLVVVFDEDDSSQGNTVPCIFYGAGIVPGQYGAAYDHYSLCKTVCVSQNVAPPANASGASTMTGMFGTVSSGSGVFYGVGEHYVQGASYQAISLGAQKSHIQSLGMTVSRQDGYNLQDISVLASVVVPGLSPVKVIPALIFYPYDVSAGVTETVAYNYGFSLGAAAATRFGNSVPIVEFGNEYDNATGSIASDGESITNYDNTRFKVLNAALRGSVDGWRSVQSASAGATKIICNASAGWLHFGFLDGMWNGKWPDGTTGHPTCRGDIVQWHWYSDMGDITQNVTGGSGTYNVLDKIHQIVGSSMPIMITELGARPPAQGVTEAQAQAFINSQMSNIVAVAASKNIVGVNWYELYDHAGDPGYGLYSGVGTAVIQAKPRWTTMKDFISAHAMP